MRRREFLATIAGSAAFALEEVNEALRQVKHSEISGAAVLNMKGD